MQTYHCEDDVFDPHKENVLGGKETPCVPKLLLGFGDRLPNNFYSANSERGSGVKLEQNVCGI